MLHSQLRNSSHIKSQEVELASILFAQINPLEGLDLAFSSASLPHQTERWRDQSEGSCQPDSTWCICLRLEPGLPFLQINRKNEAHEQRQRHQGIPQC